MNSEALCSLSAELDQFLTGKRAQLATVAQSLEAIRIDAELKKALPSEPTVGANASRVADNIDSDTRDETSLSKKSAKEVDPVSAGPSESEILNDTIGPVVSRTDVAPTVQVSGDANDPAYRLNALKMRLSKQLAKQEL